MKPIRIIIFAKAPIPGFAKTRLIPALGEQGAANLAHQLLQHTLVQAQCAKTDYVELCVTPDKEDPVWESLSLPKSVVWSNQGEGDLGARMARAAMRANQGEELVLLIGTDCPSLSSAVLRQALADLRRYDSVMVPAYDGGYVLIGLKKFDESLFINMTWSVETVAQETERRIRDLGWSLNVLSQLHDIDVPEDLQWLPESWKWNLYARE